jgi:hypothetical protein
MAKKSRAQKRHDWEKRIWSAVVEYVNTGEGFDRLVGDGLDWIGGDAEADLEQSEDIKAGATLETLAVRYRENVRHLLTWLARPEDDKAAGPACAFLMQHGNSIRYEWQQAAFDPKDRDSSLMSEWPNWIGSVVAPLCRFVKDQIDRHDVDGEPLRDVIPIGLCDREGCGKFRVIQLYRPGHIFCSNLCKATFHQSRKTKKAKAEYMREYRAVTEAKTAKKGRLIVRHKGGKRGNV